MRNSRMESSFRVVAEIDDPDVTSYQDHDVVEGSDNYWVVQAYNEAGYSDYSQNRCGYLDSVYSEGSLGLAYPDDERASFVKDDEGPGVLVEWSEPTRGYHGGGVAPATGYQILRWDVNHGFPSWDLLVENTGSRETSFIDRSILPNSYYLYKVRAWNDWGVGERSFSANVRTPDWDVPGAPKNLTVTHVDGGIQLQWNHPDDTDGEDTLYRIYRRENSGGVEPLQLLEAGYGDLKFVNNNVVDGVHYHYQVQVDGGDDLTAHGMLSRLAASAAPGPALNQPATGVPTISGTARVGETLTAGTSGITDDDGLTNVSYSYQWLANDGNADADVQGATSSSYTLKDSEEGKAIKVRVSFTDDAGNEESLTSAATAAVEAEPEPPAKPTGLTGTVVHDEVSLTWNDPGNESITGYQILRLDRDVHGLGNFQVHVEDTGSAATSYVDLDVAAETRYVYRIKARNAAGLSVRSHYFNANTPAASNNLATGVPTVAGTTQVGETLTANTSGIADADGLTNVSYSYQWVANDGTSDTDITGATDSTYTLAGGDEGKTIKVSVSFTDDEGHSETLTSAETAAVAPVEPQEPPAIPLNLEAVVNEDGTVTLAWDAPGDDSITSYQILRREPALHAIGDFQVHLDDTGSSATSYVDRDVSPDTRYVYRIKSRNVAGLSERSHYFRVDTPPAPVQNSPATGAPAITGTAQVGETLTADTSGIEDSDGLSGTTFSYQWVANDGISDADIAGATDSRYTLDSSDEGRTIKVRVAFTDDAGNDETLTSAATSAVAAAEPEEPPAQPQGLTGTATHDAISLTWNDPDDDSITGYQILRREPALHAIGDFQVQLEDTGSSAMSYVDRDVSPETRYVYRIKARNSSGLSERSHYFTADTSPAPAENSPATGAPAIGGAARVGEMLTVNTSGIADADGLTNVSYGYQWLANDGTSDTDITGATDSTYTLAAADEGKTIKVRVNFTDDAGNAEALTSAATAAVEAKPNSPATGQPSISGTAQVGDTLSADTSGIADADGLDNVVFNYQWLAADAAVQGAAQATYTLSASDEGKTIKVRVSFTDDVGNDESLTSAATAAVEAEPESQEPPDKPTGLTGTVAHDQVSLTWDDPGDESITGYQILRLDRDVDGLGNFQVHVDDTGSAATGYVDRDVAPETRYVYRIKARNAAGLSVWSHYFDANTPPASDPTPNNPATGLPTINGVTRVGETLSADSSGIADADGMDNATFSYQWVATDGGGDLDIEGATGATYTLLPIDAALRFKVRVSFTDDGGNQETLTSEVTAVVAK